jgi:hypothetical protein
LSQQIGIPLGVVEVNGGGTHVRLFLAVLEFCSEVVVSNGQGRSSLASRVVMVEPRVNKLERRTVSVVSFIFVTWIVDKDVFEKVVMLLR